jgi:hypothetical protein
MRLAIGVKVCRGKFSNRSSRLAISAACCSFSARAICASVGPVEYADVADRLEDAPPEV